MDSGSRGRFILGAPSLDDHRRLIGTDDRLISGDEKIVAMEREFRARWFVWRAALPVSMISGVAVDLLFRGRPFFTERSVVIWLARSLGGISLSQIGRVLDRHHTSIMSAFRRADEGIREKEPSFFYLLQDVFESERETTIEFY